MKLFTLPSTNPSEKVCLNTSGKTNAPAIQAAGVAGLGIPPVGKEATPPATKHPATKNGASNNIADAADIISSGQV